MAEVQKHGFEREAQAKKSGLMLSEPSPASYTAEADIPAGHSANPKNKGMPIQFKTALGSKGEDGSVDGQVMLADARRAFKCGPLELHVEIMKQDGDLKRSLGLTRMVFEDGYGKALFGSLPESELERMAKEVKGVPKGLSEEQYDRRSADISKELSRLKAAHGVSTTLQPKIHRSSKAGNRLQHGTSLSTLRSLATHVDYIPPEELVALGMSESIKSPKRVIKPKAPKAAKTAKASKAAATPQGLGGAASPNGAGSSPLGSEQEKTAQN